MASRQAVNRMHHLLMNATRELVSGRVRREGGSFDLRGQAPEDVRKSMIDVRRVAATRPQRHRHASVVPDALFLLRVLLYLAAIVLLLLCMSTYLRWRRNFWCAKWIILVLSLYSPHVNVSTSRNSG